MYSVIKILVLICMCYYNLRLVRCECLEADELPFLDQRISNNSESSTVSDQFLPAQWYSSLGPQGHYQMIDSFDLLFVSQSCGTNFPVYLKDSHPNLDSITEDPITVKACLLTFDSACAAEYSVEIRQCNERLQYKMEQTRSIAAYCFELKTPIEDIEFPPDEAKPVAADVNPTLQYYEDVDFRGNKLNAPKLVFKCNFAIQDNYFYRVYWYINGIFINTVKGPVQIENVQDLHIEENEIIALGYGLGINLRCGVRVSVEQNSILTEVTESGDFFAGIKLIDKTINLAKSEETKGFQFQSTVPLGCKHNPDNTVVGACAHEIYMVDANQTTEYTCSTSTVATNTFDKCGINLEISYDPIENFVPITYTMLVKYVGDTYDDSETFTLLLQTAELGGSHTIWRNYLIDYLTVFVVDDGKWHNKVCYAVVDPHDKTADGRPFENQNKGEFIFYRNKNYKLEVQEKTEACWSNQAYCTCAVTVRAGGDIFTVNICGRFNVMEFLSCDDNILDVRVLSNRQTYRVYTPIGTYIEIHLTHGYINLYVYVSPKDLHNTDGLCGNFDGQSANDFVKREGKDHLNFPLSWRITAEESFLTHANTINLERYGQDSMFCICEPVVGQLSNTASCSKSDHQLCKTNLDFPAGSVQKSCTVTGKRSTEANAYMQEIWRKIELSKIHDESIADIRERRSIEIIEMSDVETEAYNNCSEALKNSFAALNADAASRLGDDYLNASILACAYDITATGGAISSIDHNSMTNQELDNFYQKDITYTTSNPDTFREFKDQSCEGNCYGHGTCSNGFCTCETGFRGAYCDINITAPIHVEAIQYDGLCDKNSHAECDGCITIQTDALTADFICKRTIKQKLTDGSIVGEEYVISGQQEDIFTGYCCKQDKRKKRSTTSAPNVFVSEYEISISNDGLNFGTAQSVFEYDSICQIYTELNGIRLFYLKDGYCFIEGSCVVEGAVSVSDACLICSLQTDLYGWTSGCVSSSKTNGKNTVLIIGVCVGVVAGIILIIAVTFLLKYCKQDKQTVDAVNHTGTGNFDLKMSNARTVYNRPPTASSTRDIDIGCELYDN